MALPFTGLPADQNLHTPLSPIPMKSIALLCASLLAAAAIAEEPAAKFVDLKAPEAIEMVKKDEAEAKADPKKEKLTVLDVRTPEEYSKGHIAGATNIDYNSGTFKDSLSKLDKTKPYLVHCASGRRSAKTRELMKSLGFKNVCHLDGGLTAWEKAGGPVTQKP